MSAAFCTEEDRWRVGCASRIQATCRILMCTVVGGISVGGRMVKNLRYPDDATLLAGTKEYLISLVERVSQASEKVGLYY